ncbi:hypothetical protein C9374_007532 [Naegleria lovaniensis]|uniref:Uncharacterized protein n=1 Tax=Naegleria lovaniensis TaxID=51637 RepID=A0AA88KIY6_NAELO|nr:uncharacterized protein C9374_007532 [Naegleria lovaniensis]KAG2379393.1 hypothetical protein C9374_007532 [Naegleria lovaniensis]
MKLSISIVFLVLLLACAVCALEQQQHLTQPDSSVKLAKLIQELVKKEIKRTTRRMIRQAMREEETLAEQSDSYYYYNHAPYNTYGRAVDFIRGRNNGNNRLLADAQSSPPPVSRAGCYNQCYEKYGGMFNELFTSKVERCKATCRFYFVEK